MTEVKKQEIAPTDTPQITIRYCTLTNEAQKSLQEMIIKLREINPTLTFLQEYCYIGFEKQ